jgi:competence protein ComEA
MLYGSDESFSFKEYLSQKPWWLWLGIFIVLSCGFSIGLYGIYQLVSTNDQEIVTSNDIENQVCEQTADFGQVTVYISGAITNPGVYILETGDRIIDLLEASGGISGDADKVYVNRQFNLAMRLSDGEQLYIPTKVETISHLEDETSGEVNSSNNLSTDNQSNLISINSSSKGELIKLSGVGDVKAGKIISNRPFGSLDELVTKKIISESLFKDIEKLVEL